MCLNFSGQKKVIMHLAKNTTVVVENIIRCSLSYLWTYFPCFFSLWICLSLSLWLFAYFLSFNSFTNLCLCFQLLLLNVKTTLFIFVGKIRHRIIISNKSKRYINTNKLNLNKIKQRKENLSIIDWGVHKALGLRVFCHPG
jgi:hypothetical protein